jgi:hypothetical protein
MKRLTQLTLVGVLLLGMVSLAMAQDEGGARAGATTLQPVYRLGNFIEVGNDVFMHIIATMDARYMTVENLDFDKRIRDETTPHRPQSGAASCCTLP